jgi:hypothetical protein
MGREASRGKLLLGIAAGLSVLAAGGVLAHIGVRAGRSRNGSKFPGERAGLAVQLV